jgi:hypothetical protein
MNWLHFSDFHIGGARAPQANALKSLVETVAFLCKESGQPIDTVFLAGDLAYSGKQQEYERFRDDFYFPLMAIPMVSKAMVIAIPGNHDVDCSVGVPIAWETIGKRKQDIFFAEDDDGRSARKHRAEVFEAYWKFVTENNIRSPNPFHEVSSYYEIPELPVTILATNTAFFSDEMEHLRPRSTPIPLPSMRHFVKSEPPSKPLLILGHHSPDAFIPDQFKNFKAFLSEKKAFYLHGHEHDPSVTVKGDGTVRTIGFGATYLQSLESSSEGSYKNCFTSCSLAERLLITAFSWEAGSWKNTTSLQFTDCEVVEKVPFERVGVALPSIKGGSYEAPVQTALSKVPRAHPRPASILPIAAPNEDLWMQLVQMSDSVRQITQQGAFTVTELPEKDGKWNALLEVNQLRHLLVCIPGANHVLSAKEVETLNTRLDTEDLQSVIVISLGIFSDEARAMYLRLQTRKQMEILVNADLATHADRILSAEQRRHIRELDAAIATVRLLVTHNEVLCLIVSGRGVSTSFYLLAGDGSVLAATTPVVTALRKGNVDLLRAAYAGENHQQLLNVGPSFDENEYLQKSFDEYNSTKYAALANIGIRFSDLPLKELYVSAIASEVADNTNGRLEAFVDDHLAKFPASDALKSHIRNQLLSTFSHDAHQETSDAREFCQKYGSVLLTGDPGSGKTCFVKSEILAYCERAAGTALDQGERDWHSVHVPIMLQLSELVSELDFETAGLFAIASRLSERRGLHFPEEHMLALALQGRLALFFDGLDEVVSIERRALVVRRINDLVTEYLPFGNRIVVTSRPAAVHLVNLLPALHKLELQGLSESNIRTLAERVLSLRVVDSVEGPFVDEKKIAGKENTLVERLMRDCEQNPGVGRLAQNPLLLTLLILIYANSGPLSAKRHLIYEEAIKTLSTVRGREAGHSQISAQDLRERLGAIALSVYKRESGLLPTRGEVRPQVQAVMERQRGEKVEALEADAFIQKVAESTGLITIGGRQDEGNDDAVVTFMHHSFLEYFAAIGLSLNLEEVEIEKLVHEPRWREILTLLSGIIGENADIAPILTRFLQAVTDVTEVDAKLLLFSMDCALESEIPSESAQRLLARAINKAVKNGPARIDPWVQAEIGRRLGSLLESCGSGEFERSLVDLIGSAETDHSAAAIRIAGYACENGFRAESLTKAVNTASARNEDGIAGAICWAASQSESFRTDATLHIISSNLTRTKKRKQYAFDAIAKIPALAAKHWAEIINGIDDDDGGVKKAASNAAVQAGINGDLVAMNTAKKDILVRALRFYDFTSNQERHPVTVKRETLERLLESGDRRNRLIGIGLLPMSDQSEIYVFDHLFGILRERDDREEIVAALDALRFSGDALSLFNVSDIKIINEWLQRGTSDIRAAAIRLLGMFNRDLTAVNVLLRLDADKMLTDEFVARLAALGGARVSKADACNAVGVELEQLLDPKAGRGKEHSRRMYACLDALRRLEENVPDRLVGKITRLVEDYRVDSSVRGRALIAVPAASIPSVHVVKRITEWLEKGAPEFELELVQLPGVLAKKCRQNVDYVIACVGSLADLRQSAIKLHKKVSARQSSSDNELKVTELRSGIEDVTSIIVAFNEFIEK